MHSYINCMCNYFGMYTTLYDIYLYIILYTHILYQTTLYIYTIIHVAGPGGVHVFTEQGEPIGLISLHDIATNCAIGSDGWLYITLAHGIARVRIMTKPVRHLSKITRK